MSTPYLSNSFTISAVLRHGRSVPGTPIKVRTFPRCHGEFLCCASYIDSSLSTAVEGCHGRSGCLPMVWVERTILGRPFLHQSRLGWAVRTLNRAAQSLPVLPKETAVPFPAYQLPLSKSRLSCRAGTKSSQQHPPPAPTVPNSNAVGLLERVREEKRKMQ